MVIEALSIDEMIDDGFHVGGDEVSDFVVGKNFGCVHFEYNV